MNPKSFGVLSVSLLAGSAFAFAEEPKVSEAKDAPAVSQETKQSDEIAQLRAMVEAQGKQIAELRAALEALTKKEDKPAPVAPEAPKPTTKVTVGGLIRWESNYSSAHTNNVEAPVWVVSPDDPLIDGADDDEFNMSARKTRFWIDAVREAPFGSFDRATARVEADFLHKDTGALGSAPLRIRQAYVRLDQGPWSYLAGQTFDLASPLNPTWTDGIGLWGVGNTGDRRPQFRVTYAQPGGPWNFAVAATALGTTDGLDLDKNNRYDAEDAGRPAWQARLGYAKGNVNVGLFGFLGSQSTDKPIEGETNFHSQMLGADLEWTLAKGLALRGELWSGSNLSDIRGGILQGVNVKTGQEIQAWGGWAELVRKFGGGYTLSVGYSFDDPNEGDLSGGMRSRNESWFIGQSWALGGGLEASFNYALYRTAYVDWQDNDAHRLSAVLTYKF